MAEPDHAVERAKELLPDVALAREDAPTFGRDAVLAPAAAGGPLAPPPFDPAAAFQAIQQGIERRHLKADGAVRARLDLLGDLVAVARAFVEQPEDEERGAAALQLPFGKCPGDMWRDNISAASGRSIHSSVERPANARNDAGA
jgi:hypothetical protein